MAELDDLVVRLRALGSHPVDPAVASEHLTAMAAMRAGRARPVGRFQRLKVGAAFAAGIVLGGTSLASAGVMGETVQDKVADAASHVNVDLPGGTQRSTEGCPAGTTYKNHGQFVKDGGDPKAPCGKPGNAVDKAKNDAEDPSDANENGSDHASACRPPWAGKGKAGKDIKAQNPNWEPPAECAADDQGANADERGDVDTNNDELTPSSTTPSTAAVTPPGGGQDDNAGVPSGGSIPGQHEQGDEHRTDTTGAGAPSTLPPQAHGDGPRSDTTTTPLP